MSSASSSSSAAARRRSAEFAGELEAKLARLRRRRRELSR